MMTCIVNKKPNHQHTQHIATGTTKENCISHCLLTSHTTPPRMIHRLHLHLRFFVLLTHAPHTELPTLQISFIALQFGINHQKIHNECLSVPILATNPNHLTAHSTAVQYALVGVYEQLLLNPPKLFQTAQIYNSFIICVVLYYFILFADSSTLVKIDD